MYLNELFRKSLFIAGACIATSCLGIFTACDHGSTNSASDNLENLNRSAYAISVNEEEEKIYINSVLKVDQCIYRNGKLAWSKENYPFEARVSYYISYDGTLELVTSDDNYTELWNSTNTSVFGVWYGDSTDTLSRCIITRDSLIFESPKESGQTENGNPPVETPINIRTSYFLYDLYRCLSGREECYIGTWHFAKDAKSYNSKYESELQISVRDVIDNSLIFTYSGQDFFVNVDHVQVDDQNNGHSLYSAYVISNGETCHYQNLSKPITKDLCKEEYWNYLEGTYMDDGGDDKDGDGDTADDDDDVLIYAYIDDNSQSFINCVKGLLHP